MLNSLFQPTILAEKLDQLHIHVGITRARCQFCLEQVEQPVPTLLTLTTQQAFLIRVKNNYL